MSYSAPIPDPKHARKLSPDWLVFERRTASVIVHRFIRQEEAEAFARPELDTNDRELDERRIEDASPSDPS